MKPGVYKVITPRTFHSPQGMPQRFTKMQKGVMCTAGKKKRDRESLMYNLRSTSSTINDARILS